MSSKIGVLASALAVSAALASHAEAFVVYTVENPFAAPFPFILFTYDSPTFITTDTTVPVADLAFANPANTITGVEFIPSSATVQGTSEVDVFQSGGDPPQSFNGDQYRYYPLGTLAQYGVTPGDSSSFGYPRSELSVAAPEPATIGLLGTGLLCLLGLRRRSKSDRSPV